MLKCQHAAKAQHVKARWRARGYLCQSAGTLVRSAPDACVSCEVIYGADASHSRSLTMPLYEYVCGRCSKQFEELVANDAATPDCPTCAQHDEVSRIRFARVRVGKKEDLRPPNIKVPRLRR